LDLGLGLEYLLGIYNKNCILLGVNMLTMFCLLVYGVFPSQMGIPLWALFLSLSVDLLFMISTRKKENKNV